MKSTKLEIIDLTNNDIIATSCASVFGVAFVDGDGNYAAYQNGEHYQQFYNGTVTGYPQGYYHVDSQGNIIGPCEVYDPINNNVRDVDDAHDTWLCFATGTKITLADGSLENIEDIKAGDCVLTFNHEESRYESQEVYLAYKGKEKNRSFTLKFTNNIELSIVGRHDLFEKESCRYVTIIEDNATSFIGKHFYNAKENRYEELLSVVYNDEPVCFYSIYTYCNHNSIANNMLSVPDDVDAFLNLYKFNEDLSIDKEALKQDIEKYGLFDFASISTLTKEEFDKQRVKYVNIITGRGLSTFEKLVASHQEYLEEKDK